MKKVLFLFLLLAGMTNVYGQKFAVKSNLLYDATATINLGVEMEQEVDTGLVRKL